MGMAAGQARLLSITSRMSDNELRAQIINNNKMRLATQSSQVSETYVTALNKAQMMFTNYGPDNKSSFQQLTFNALTAYNPYNNQYAVSNASGQILISEQDAKNYIASERDINKFLKLYGIEKDTTYFTNVAQFYDEKNKGIQFKTGTFDENGNEIRGYLSIPEGQNAEDYLYKLYYGEEKVQLSYTEKVASTTNYNYNTKLDKYLTTRDEFLSTISEKMTEKLTNFKSNGTNDSDKKTLEQIKTDLKGYKDKTQNETNIKEVSGLLGKIGDIVTLAEPYKLEDYSEYFTTLKDTITNTQGTTVTTTMNADRGYQAVVDKEDKTKINIISTINNPEDSSGSNTETIYSIKYNGSNHVLVLGDGTQVNIDSSTGKATYWEQEGPDKDKDGKDITHYHATEPTGANITKHDIVVNSNLLTAASKLYNEKDNNDYDYSKDESVKLGDFKVTDTVPNTLETMVNTGLSIIDSLQSSIYTVWDPEQFINPENTEDPVVKAYNDASKELAEFFGINNLGAEGAISRAELDDIQKIYDKYNNPLPADASDAQKEAKARLEMIYSIYQMDCILNTYGEPKTTYIDKNNGNENGDAKAKWYQNLFKRIESGGYQVLQNGLAASTDWIQFAFESGIITMEQVDEKNSWNTLIYSNCSDITEQTNDAAIAKAEAEYKAAMNKIENKDKRYDLELKNIDTEHNSLQTEYDSIKTAIDKNIERTFKLYG